MKKLLLLACAIPTMMFAQDQQEPQQNKYTISANFVFSEPSQFGVSVERINAKDKDGTITSSIANLSVGSLTLENDGLEVSGTGVIVDLGSRLYWESGKTYGLYSENFLTYGEVNFDDKVDGIQFEGKYSYFSLINPNIGYKIMIGKNFALDPSAGVNWKWEIKGKGDVDNKYIDNFTWNIGVKLGYTW